MALNLSHSSNTNSTSRSSSTSSYMSIIKLVVAISTSLAVFIKLCTTTECVSPSIRIWSRFINLESSSSSSSSWLKPPPYLYLLFNCIIITIVLSSKLQFHFSNITKSKHLVRDQEYLVQINHADHDTARRRTNAGGHISDNKNTEEEASDETSLLMQVLQLDSRLPPDRDDDMINIYQEEAAAAPPPHEPATINDHLDHYTPSQIFSKPPVSTRFSHRKLLKPPPQGVKTLRVSKPKQRETLESTWKTITDGRPVPLTRHLRKSETWETHGGCHLAFNGDMVQGHNKVTKSETFNGRSSGGIKSLPPLSRSSGSGKLRKEPSLGQDELNRRVEAFINKFNEDMRLQRQESLDQYKEMIKRGSH